MFILFEADKKYSWLRMDSSIVCERGDVRGMEEAKS